MKIMKNVFGEGKVYTAEDFGEKVYITSAACMSVWSDALSWANINLERITNDITKADTIVVLGCQVTDLAVLNDLRVAQKLYKETGKDIYMGGCLSQRWDIELPSYIKRLDVVREVNVNLDNLNLVNYEPPFWVPDFKESEDELAQGNIFRNMYPLKIGAGCHGKCKYCTIRHTRGETYVMDPKQQEKEFINNDNVVLISDSPTVEQINEWCEIALRNNKPFSVRNIEPQTLVKSFDSLLKVSKLGLLKILHCPVQSFDKEVLEIMNRNYKMTIKAVELMQILRNNNVIVATNIIIDYTNNGKEYPNYEVEKLDELFDYYSWNPYFDGNWNIKKAEQRMKKYIK